MKLCQCGCGGRTNQSRRFILNHHQKILLRSKYIVDAKTGCWLLINRKPAKTGYAGNISVENRSELAHRGFYKIIKGPIPEGMCLDHLCRNRICVNPDHLEPVTHAENSRRGIGTKLTIEKVRHIKTRMQNERGSDLAIEYGISHSTICDIMAERTWANV